MSDLRLTRIYSRHWLTAMALMGFVLLHHGARPGSVESEDALTGGTSAQIPVRSFEELKFSRTLKQVADFSFGSAPLATLSTCHYEHPVAERAILHDMIEHGDPKTIEAKGFLMLDMKNYLARQGLQSGGFRLPLEKIAEVHVPGIVLINHNGYDHFAVLEGLRDGRVLLADPSRGTRATDITTFEKEWNGILFIVLNNADRAQRSSNLAEDWATQPRATWEQVRDMFGLTQLGWRNSQVY